MSLVGTVACLSTPLVFALGAYKSPTVGIGAALLCALATSIAIHLHIRTYPGGWRPGGYNRFTASMGSIRRSTITAAALGAAVCFLCNGSKGLTHLPKFLQKCAPNVAEVQPSAAVNR